MISIFRILNPDFDPPATVERFGVSPHLTPRESNPRATDEELRKMASDGVAQLEKQDPTPVVSPGR